jgi:hypothetical protein
LDELVDDAMLPSYDNEADLDISGVPTVWATCIEKASKRHLALHAFCLASADSKLRKLLELRSAAYQICDDTGDERGLYWLQNRPGFFINGMAL